MESFGASDAPARDEELEIGTTSAQAHMKVVLNFWKEFNLDGRRLQLDKQGLELQDAKDASLVRRKHLAELTKEFRKKPDHDKISGVQRLVKAYQEEIDALAKRSRASDSAFFSLYKALYEAPDPAQALERMASERPRAAASELEVQKLQAELAEYEEEFNKLKNQDITIRGLEDKIAELEDGAEANVEQEADARLKEVQEAADAKMEAAREREAQLERSLQVSEDTLAEARQAADGLEGRLFESSRRAQEAEAAWEVEREILSQTNESTQAHLTRLEQEVQQLRESERQSSRSSPAGKAAGPSSSLAADTAAAAPGGVSHADAVDAELAELTRVNTQLRGEMVARSSAWREEKVSLEAALRASKEAAATAAAAAAELRKELESRPVVSEVKALRQQLRVLQQLEFNADNDDEDEAGEVAIAGDEPHGADPEDTASHVERTMEQVIRSRVRRLEADLTSSRRLAEERGAEATRLQRSLDAAAALSAERLETIDRLEDDLAAASQAKSSGVAGGSTGAGGGVGAPNISGGGGGEGANALRELLGVAEEEAGGGGGGGAEVGGHGVLGIVQAQRDRFRRRIKELEAEREDEQREARGARGVMESLQKDNLQLYEKVRFLQSYQRGSTLGAANSGRVALSHDLEAGKGTVVGAGEEQGSRKTEARYGQLYEARINPFTQFSQRERQRKYQELTVAEKITLNTTRMFLGNKFARNFVFFYVVVLHLVVFFTLNYWSHSHSANCMSGGGAGPEGRNAFFPDVPNPQAPNPW
eukprot:g16337.t1